VLCFASTQLANFSDFRSADMQEWSGREDAHGFSIFVRYFFYSKLSILLRASRGVGICVFGLFNILAHKTDSCKINKNYLVGFCIDFYMNFKI